MLKSTQVAGKRPTPGSCSCPAPSPVLVLDTFSLSAPSAAPKSGDITAADVARKKLEKRAQAKYVTNLVAFPLAQLNSPLRKQYKRSTNCTAEVTEQPGKYTSLYCNCRWCLVCSRLRTARLIVGYLPAIQAMKEKWFLTLSRPNVPGVALADEIQYYLRTATLIQRHLREKRKLDYSSLRKIECTYNEEVNTYHPHFHFIFDSWEAANAFLQEWLVRNPTAQLNKGNLLKKANDKSVIELFKYFTKVVSKSASSKSGQADRYRIHLEALDTMFQAMQRVRTFQPCGVIKSVSEDVEPEQTVDSGRAQVNHWKWLNHDWVNVETEAALTGFTPSANQLDIAKHIVYPAGVRTLAPTDATPYFVDKETGEVIANEAVHLGTMRNSMRYAKIYPVLDGERAARRRADSGLPFIHEDDVQQHAYEAPAPLAPSSVEALPLFAQPVAAPAPAARVEQPPVARRSTGRAAAMPGVPPPGKKSPPVRKKSAVNMGVRPAQKGVRDLPQNALLFAGENLSQ